MCVCTGAVPLVSATFGMGSSVIVEHVRCNGTERQLSECTIRDSHDGQCSHSQDAGVRCCELLCYYIVTQCLLEQFDFFTSHRPICGGGGGGEGIRTNPPFR